MKRILHLTGSAESDFFAELSVLYAADCLRETTDPSRYETAIAHVSPGGAWRFPDALTPEAIDAAPPLSLDAAVEHILGLRPDLMLPQMFCLPGMTSFRSLFDLLAIPYVGNAAETMALAADKGRARAVVAAAGVAVPEAELLRSGDLPSISPPYVVKPVDGDNSSGLSLVHEPGQAAGARDRALAVSPAALAERYVELGREVRCGVLERGTGLHVLPLEEYALDTETHPIRRSEDKLARDDSGSGLRLVAKDTPDAWIVAGEDPVCAAVAEAARRCHRALGCRDYSLFDFRVDPQGRPWFLEAGLYCSFARSSVIATMARAEGVDTAELLAAAIEQTEWSSTRGGSAWK